MSKKEMNLDQFEKEFGIYNRQIKRVSKPYTQFSKQFVKWSLVNLIIIEIFVMVMIYRTGDTSQLAYLITGLAVEMLGVGIWYMKNSEAEKKARINAEVERMKMSGIVGEPFDTQMDYSNQPDTYYQGNTFEHQDGSSG